MWARIALIAAALIVIAGMVAGYFKRHEIVRLVHAEDWRKDAEVIRICPDGSRLYASGGRVYTADRMRVTANGKGVC